MFRSACLAVTAAALLSTTAMAADLPRKVAPPIFTPVPVFTWTGFYIGANAGYAFSENDTIRTTGRNNLGAPGGANLQLNVDRNLRRPNVPLPTEGFAGGGQVGYNVQFTPGSGFVLGVEADAQYTDLNGRRTEDATNLAFNPNRLVNTYRTELGFLGTVRGRIGYAFDRVLVYGTGGFAYGDVTQSVSFRTGAPVTYSGSRSSIETGYAYGGGIEYALPTESFLNFFRASAITMKGEYLRYDLGARSLFVASTGGPGLGYDSRFRTEGSLVRAGLNYKFGSY